MSISKEQVEHIAKLARIEIKDVGKFQKDLSAILDYVKQLEKVNTKNVNRIAQITDLEDIVREDVAGKSLKDVLKNVPDKKGDLIKVPKILWKI